MNVLRDLAYASHVMRLLGREAQDLERSSFLWLYQMDEAEILNSSEDRLQLLARPEYSNA